MDKRKKYAVISACLLVLIIAAVAIKLPVNPQNASLQQSVEVIQPVSEEQVEIKISETLNAEPIKPEIVTYTVKSGDTLESISKEYGVSADSIATSSGISKDSILKEGQQLRFPSVLGIVYKIRSGETLWDISSTYEVDIENITAANDMVSPDKLKIGQEIIIPGIDKIKTFTAVASIGSKGSTSKVSSRSGSSVSTKKKTASVGSTWPVKGVLTSRFGPRWGTTHKGIDIAAPTGTNVYAFMGGKVVHSGWEGGYGKLVIIDHGNGLRSYYGHNSKLMVSTGEYVDKGDHIAEVGSTGDSTGPHCHFEIRINGVAVNPLAYLK